ncbi:MAG TPA: hypothetical protein VM840_11155 [Actinomycetota bacterium]|nr:hypothetical protein [Actinomycetota bacterium]
MPGRGTLWVGGVLATTMVALAAAAWLGAFGDRGGWPLWLFTFLTLQGAVMFVVAVVGRRGRGGEG